MKVAAAIGGCLVALGLLVGLVPVSSGGASCGSGLHPEDPLFLGLTQGVGVRDSCQSLLSLVSLPMWGLLGVGVLLLLGCCVRGVKP